MPLTSLHQVDREFFNQFLSKATYKELSGEPSSLTFPFLTLSNTLTNSSFYALIRHAKRGGGLNLTEHRAYYPSISIYPFAPIIDRTRLYTGIQTYEGGLNPSPIPSPDNDNGAPSGKIYYFPSPFDFKYQVSVVSSEYGSFTAIVEWFYANFDFSSPQPCLLLNKVATTKDGDLGDVVPYKLEETEDIRDDGYFEKHFTFTLKTYVNVKLSEEHPLVSTIRLLLHQQAETNPAVYDEIAVLLADSIAFEPEA